MGTRWRDVQRDDNRETSVHRTLPREDRPPPAVRPSLLFHPAFTLTTRPENQTEPSRCS
jgi:hypothetical protein